MKKRQALLSEEQWSVLIALFPEPRRRKDGRGRPWASNRACLQGILWFLRTGARWRDLPEEYPDGSTCWRRLRMWEEQGVCLRAWRKLLAQMDERRLLDWEEAFLDETFVTAKKGSRRRQDTSRERYEVHGGGRRPWRTCRSATASAQISEHRLEESTLQQVKVPRSGRGRPRSLLKRVIADRGYDSDPLRSRLKRRGTELIAPTAARTAIADLKINESSADTASAGKSNAPTHGCKTSDASRSAMTASSWSFRDSSTVPASSSR